MVYTKATSASAGPVPPVWLAWQWLYWFLRGKNGDAEILTYWCLESWEAVVAATSHKHYLKEVSFSPEMGKNLLYSTTYDPGMAQQFDGFAHPCCILYHGKL